MEVRTMSSREPQLLTAEQAKKFIEEKGGQYEALIKLVRQKFDEDVLISGGRTAIYRVYSRGEKQGGKELKEAWKIAERVNLIRTGKNKDGTISSAGAKPGYPVQDLGDIVGLTIVCV